MQTIKRSIYPFRLIAAKILLCFFIIHISGCASIFIPLKQKVTIKTENEDSKVFVNNEEVGSGETVVTKVKKDGTKQVVIQTPGYRDSYYVLTQSKRVAAWWPLLIPDILLLYPAIVDGANRDKSFRFPKVNTLPSEYKYIYRANDEKYINLDAIKLGIENKNKDILTHSFKYYENMDVYGEIKKVEKESQMKAAKQEKKDAKKKKKNYLNKDDEKIKYDDTKFSENIYKTLKKTGYIDTVNKVFQDNNNTLVIEGVIKKASVFFVQNPTYSYYMKAKINMMWYIKNTFGEKVDSINSWSYSGDFAATYYTSSTKTEAMYADAVDISYFDLMKNDKFIKYLKIDSVFKISDPVLTIIKPRTTVQEVTDATGASVIVKRKDGGHGSGFAISEDGYIITNFHVIAGDVTNKQADIVVITSEGEELAATIVRYNRMRDVALLKVNKKFDRPFAVSDIKGYKKLMEVYTVGTPKSIELGQSVSMGLLSNERKANNNNLLQLSMSINSGNSGGPLFDKSGALHGIVTSKLVGFSTEGVGFAIPSYMIPEYLNLTIK